MIKITKLRILTVHERKTHFEFSNKTLPPILFISTLETIVTTKQKLVTRHTTLDGGYKEDRRGTIFFYVVG